MFFPRALPAAAVLCLLSASTLTGCGQKPNALTLSAPSVSPVTPSMIGNIKTIYTQLTAAADTCVATKLCSGSAATTIATIEAKDGPIVNAITTLTPPTTLAALEIDLQTLRALPGVGTAVPNPTKTQSDINSVLSVLTSLVQIGADLAPLIPLL